MLAALLGLPSTYRYLALLALVVAVIAAFKVAVWRAESAGRWAGKAEIQALWDAERVATQVAALAAQQRYREQEQAAAQSLAAAVNHYREALRREKERASLDALLDSGVRLSVPATCPGDSGGAAETAVASARTPVQVRAELSREAAEFLDGEAGRADAVVHTLNLCVETLALERKK